MTAFARSAARCSWLVLSAVLVAAPLARAADAPKTPAKKAKPAAKAKGKKK